MEKERLMAVWEYDLPPYYKCGEVNWITSDGSVVPAGYSGMSFKPIKIMPYDERKITNLKKLTESYCKDSRRVDLHYKEMVEMLFDLGEMS